MADGEIQEKILVTMRINFDFDKANIRPDDFSTMSQIGEILNTYPGSQVFISGHTDSIGTYVYNISLSQERVDSVMTYLTLKEEVAFSRFFNPIGYGELKPVEDNGNDEGRFRNRRVDFLIYTIDKKPEIPEASAIKTVKMLNDSTINIVGNGILTFQYNLMNNPARLVVDFPNIFLLSDKNNYEFNMGPITRARLGYHPGKLFTRVVFDMAEVVAFEIDTIDNKVIIKLK